MIYNEGELRRTMMGEHKTHLIIGRRSSEDFWRQDFCSNVTNSSFELPKYIGNEQFYNGNF